MPSAQIIDFRKAYKSHAARRFEARAAPFERGLILSTPVKLNEAENSILVNSNQYDHDELMRLCLFCDKGVITENTALGIGRADQVKFLEECGIIERKRFYVSGDIATAVADSYRNCFVTLEAQNPGAWAISGNLNGLEFRKVNFRNGRGALVEFFNAIPLPERSVGFEDALEFRYKRNDELIELRTEIEQFYENWAYRCDRSHALEQAKLRIRNSTKKAELVLAETNLPYKMVTLSVRFGFTAMAAYSIGQYMKEQPLPDPTSTVMAATTGAAYWIRATMQEAPKLSTSRLAPYGYAARVCRGLY